MQKLPIVLLVHRLGQDSSCDTNPYSRYDVSRQILRDRGSLIYRVFDHFFQCYNLDFFFNEPQIKMFADSYI